MKPALIVVDVQVDFCPGGSLAVKGGDRVIRPLNALIARFHRAGMPVVFTRDWHPKDHCSFKTQGGRWPVHCVGGTQGAEFHPLLVVPRGSILISKATDPKEEAYSGFQATGLAGTLQELGVTDLYIGGLATDYCVKNTALDAIVNDFRVFVLGDCVKGVDVERGDSRRALEDMRRHGAVVLRSAAVRLPTGPHNQK